MSLEENRLERLNQALNYIRNCILYYRSIVELRGGDGNLRRNTVMVIVPLIQFIIYESIDHKNPHRNSSFSNLEIIRNNSINFINLFNDDNNQGINRNNEKKFLCKKRLRVRDHGLFEKLEIENIGNRVIFSENNENTNNLDIITTNNSKINANRVSFTSNNLEENSILSNNPGLIITTNNENNINRGNISQIKNSPISSILNSMVDLDKNIPPKKNEEDKTRNNMDNNNNIIEKNIQFNFPSKIKSKKKSKNINENLPVFKVHDSSSETFFI